jgi:hypothetical protein
MFRTDRCGSHYAKASGTLSRKFASALKTSSRRRGFRVINGPGLEVHGLLTDISNFKTMNEIYHLFPS